MSGPRFQQLKLPRALTSRHLAEAFLTASTRLDESLFDAIASLTTFLKSSMADIAGQCGRYHHAQLAANLC